MQHMPKQPSKESWIAIGMFIFMVWLKFFPKGLEPTNGYCYPARSCPADPPGLGVLLDPKLWIILFAPIGYWIAFALEVGLVSRKGELTII